MPRNRTHRTLTADWLREVLDYDPATGIFTWRVQRSPHRPVGSRAGSLHFTGEYWQIGIGGRIYLAHRLAWLHVHGEWPTDLVDHRNGNGLDNCLANLRAATQAQNNQNQRKPQTRSRSGYLGVTFHRASRKWHAVIVIDGRRVSLGYYDDAETAHTAYVKAKRDLHPYGML